ncbi:flotillin-like FloA family protein [Blastopirellula retiformator]|uniref:SigmaW regulon antibacterial n=1 Tax=Blastopirellula retiformator TaxID=2527970 RepID=A0A5C5V923_9BACT|nr:flotillin-like FloA family protein [Blastopirellula retiformator]TWT34357.1 SigmaW regulon antibacterial [Blastopirellula retiformator]
MRRQLSPYHARRLFHRRKSFGSSPHGIRNDFQLITFWSLIAVTLVLVGLVWLLAQPLRLWLQAYATGTRIGFLDLLFMSLRQVSAQEVVDCKIMAIQSGLPPLPTSDLEAQYLAGGNIRRVTLAVIAADRAGISLDWETAAAIDLAGRDILDAVQTSVRPKVIVCPDPNQSGSEALYCVAQDGIQLKVCVLVTVRTNLLQLIGGATESTVIARVGQGVISAIGGCQSYSDPLRDPALISRMVFSQELDAQTAFSIVSIDIAQIDVQRNIGAQLQIDRADADFRVAAALAEQRRAEAIANQQVMQAKCTNSRANLICAEAAVPAALADAIRRGQLRLRRTAPPPKKPRGQFPHLAHLTALAPSSPIATSAPHAR